MEKIGSEVTGAKKSLGSYVDKMSDKVSNGALQEQIESGYSAVRHQAVVAYDATAGLVRRYPVAAVLLSSAVGILVATMFRSRSKSHQ
jgi:hypothetical protein